MRLQPVPSAHVGHYWPSVESLIEAATARSNGRHSAATIKSALIDKQMQLWLVMNNCLNAVIVTELLTYPTGLKVCGFVIVTGENHQKWLRLAEDIKGWAKENGCERIEGWARPGWAKITGWKETHRLIEEGL